MCTCSAPTRSRPVTRRSRRAVSVAAAGAVVVLTGCAGPQAHVSLIGKAAPIDLLVVGSRAGWPPDAAPLLAARPKFARPQYNRDETIAFTRAKL